MSPDDLRLTAQLVAAGRVHCVSDEAVMALARRVLELEAREAQLLDAVKSNHQMAVDAEQHKTALAQSLEQMTALVTHWEGVAAANALDGFREVDAEREACAKVVEECKTGAWDSDAVRKRAAAAIRARGAK